MASERVGNSGGVAGGGRSMVMSNKKVEKGGEERRDGWR